MGNYSVSWVGLVSGSQCNQLRAEIYGSGVEPLIKITVNSVGFPCWFLLLALHLFTYEEIQKTEMASKRLWGRNAHTRARRSALSHTSTDLLQSCFTDEYKTSMTHIKRLLFETYSFLLQHTHPSITKCAGPHESINLCVCLCDCVNLCWIEWQVGSKGTVCLLSGQGECSSCSRALTAPHGPWLSE